MPSVTTPHGEIAVTIDGSDEAPALLFVNSLGTDRSMWAGQTAHLADRFRIVRFDKPGHGASSPPGGDLTIDALAGVALSVLDALEIGRAQLCGLSIGGMVAMQMALAAPERVARLILANTAAHLPPKALWNTRIETVRARGMDAIAEDVMARWFTPAFRESNPAVVAQIRQTLAATSPRGYTACCAAVRDMDLRARIGRIACPTLVINGAADIATPPAMGDEIAKAIASAAAVTIPGAHLSNLESPDMFNETLEGFLDTDE